VWRSYQTGDCWNVIVQTCLTQLNIKVPLSGQELVDHNEAIRLAAEKKASEAVARTRSRKLLEADEIESDDDEDSDSDGEGANDPNDNDPSRTSRSNGLDSWDDTAGGGVGEDDSSQQQVSFDIYVKGQTTRSTAFFKAATSANAPPRFRMFPGGEKRGRKVDMYGECIDVGVWLRRGKEIEEEVGETAYVRAAKRRREEEEEKNVRISLHFFLLGLSW
jgi:cleavage and polyadenylation specificity factor subunit 2